MQYLRQSTASQSVLIGPFIDDTDGKTAETALTIANTDIRLSANGGNMFSKTSGGGTHDEAGWYTITLDATDSATVGRLQVSVDVAGALPVFAEFQILEEAIYDSLLASGATGDLLVDVAAWNSVSLATTNPLPNAAADGIGGLPISDAGGLDMDAMNTNVSDIETAVGALNNIAATDIVSAGAITTLAGAVVNVDTVDTTTVNTDMLTAAEVNTEVDIALSDIHLDHLFATDYDPAAIPGVAGAWINESTQDDGTGAIQFTAKMLENVASSGGGFVTGSWRWSTDVTATDPTAGRVKGDNATLASITNVYLSQLTNGGFNGSSFIEALDDGDVLLVAVEGSGSNFIQFDVSGTATDNGVWYTIPGTVSDSGGAFGNNNTMSVTFAYAADDAATIASAVWNALTVTHTNAGSFGLSLGDVDTITSNMTFTVANELDANVKSISDDTTAADALELAYDGTGLIGDTYPFRQDQGSNIASGGGGLKVKANTPTVVTVGTQTSGTAASTEELDGVLNIITNAAGNTDFYYEFNVGTTGVATGIIWDGFVNQNNDSNQVFFWDWVATSYKQIGTIQGQNPTTVNSQNFEVPIGATDTNGDVRIRFLSTDSVDTNTDRVWIEYTSVAAKAFILQEGTAQSGTTNTIRLEVGDVDFNSQYVNAKVLTIAGTGTGQEVIVVSSLASTDTLTITPAWFVTPDATTEYVVIPAQVHATTQGGSYTQDAVHISASGSTGAIPDVDGINTNPIDDGQLTNARIVADVESLTKYMGRAGSSYILNATHDLWSFEGSGSTCDLSDESVSGSRFTDMIVTGAGTGASPVVLRSCLMLNVSLANAIMLDCPFVGTFNMTGAVNYRADNCESSSAIAPIFNYGALGNQGLQLTGWNGPVEIQNMGTGADTCYISGNGSIIVNVNCTGGTLTYAGDITVIDNSGGAVTIVRGMIGDINATTELNAEPTGVPAADATLAEKVAWLLTLARNKGTQTATTKTLFADDGTTPIATSTVSDDGTTFTRGEYS